MKKIIIIVLALMTVLPLKAQDSLYARRIICDLSSPMMLGRGYDQKGDSIAAAYLRAELRTIGFQHLGKDYYQYFEFTR